jgi:MEMO1 family protein
MADWFPQDKKELDSLIDSYYNQKQDTIRQAKINGLIVPHAGYEYSGKIAGTAYSLLKNKKIKKAIILGPSHYKLLKKTLTTDKFSWKTPLGEIKIFNTGFPTSDIEQEHSIKNQVPFLQKLGITEIMPLMIGEIVPEEAKRIAEKIFKEDAIFVFSTDLSHFMHYDMANKIDRSSIKIIENLETENIENLDACGKYPILVMMYLCRLMNTRPKLIEYKNSGDVTNDKIHGVVGYASFYF